ncbi:hypothetical protein [Pseudonocardia asaccharolytica]|uniref:Uncharacterized protein n=1 Tax=Pseudonocardia asaccharolytica DSM 44247 = NBRC 16224 TaxID=1123024 RepID=A0A511D6T9_9PSEU|nr:hypothetical protein [Pseudonocardia asaccharolytica]GEL20506.1 hypothetical protein PA7_43430 [Pseudonocardia asaccharolytica DSM 44247 = NBRC 16224]
MRHQEFPPRQQSPRPAPQPVRPPESDAPEPEEAPKKGLDLSINKVVAGAGAAATSALFGSFFGVSGTVAGAALGSVIITVGSTIYQRSLDRTRDEVKARIKLPSGRTVDVKRDAPTKAIDLSKQITIPLQRTGPGGVLRPVSQHASGQPTQHSAPPTSARRLNPRRVLVLSGVTVVIFVLGLLVVTGIEWAKGSPISGGDAGTSVGRVLDRSAAADTDRGADPGSDSGITGSSETTEAPASSEPPTSPTASRVPAPSREPGATGSENFQRRPETTGSEAPQPTRERVAPTAGASAPSGG